MAAVAAGHTPRTVAAEADIVVVAAADTDLEVEVAAGGSHGHNSASPSSTSEAFGAPEVVASEPAAHRTLLHPDFQAAAENSTVVAAAVRAGEAEEEGETAWIAVEERRG